MICKFFFQAEYFHDPVGISFIQTPRPERSLLPTSFNTQFKPEFEPEFEPEFSPGQLSNRAEPDRSVLSQARGCRGVQDTGAEQLIPVLWNQGFYQDAKINHPQDVQEAS